MSLSPCLNPQTPINLVLNVKYSAAIIKSATRNSTLTPLIVTDEKIIPEILSAIGDSSLSIKQSKLIVH